MGLAKRDYKRILPGLQGYAQDTKTKALAASSWVPFDARGETEWGQPQAVSQWAASMGI